jgi:DNA-binding NtrC family response regulator
MASYSTVLARDTAIALELLTEKRFGLIILEVEWAKKDQHRFLEKLPQYAPGVPVVVITVFPAETDFHPQIMAKLAKPFSVKHLLAAVSEHIVV